jgi:hypothetical protein
MQYSGVHCGHTDINTEIHTHTGAWRVNGIAREVGAGMQLAGSQVEKGEAEKDIM